MTKKFLYLKTKLYFIGTNPNTRPITPTYPLDMFKKLGLVLFYYF